MKSRDLILVALGRLVQMGLVFLAVRAVTHYLPTREVGVFFLLQSLVGFFGLVVVNPVGSYFNRELHGWMERGLGRKAVRHFLRFAAISAVVAVAALAVVLELPLTNWNAAIGGTALLLATGVMVLGATINNTFIPALNLLERRGLFVGLTVASQAIALLMAIALIKWTTPIASQWIVATGSVFSLFGLFAYVLLMRIAPASPAAIDEAHPYRHARAFALPLVVANLGVWGLTQGYRPLVENQHGLDALAVIGLGLGLAASLAGALETLVHQLFLPRFYKQSHNHHHSERINNWSGLWAVVVPVYVGAVLFMLLFSKSIVVTLSGDKFTEAARFLSFGACAELMRMLGNLFALYSQSERRTHMTIAPYLGGAAIGLIGAALMQPDQLGFAIVAGQLVTLVGLSRATLKDIGAQNLRLPLRALLIFALTPAAAALMLQALSLPAIASVGLGAAAMAAATIVHWRGLRGEAQ
ncbi:MAG: hypothetical protein IPJ84_13455 [Bdellovibrionales bacterium]|nr:hypothetical protein [Bdellovibrionales bacterium]